jgi:DNA-binding beta-propeller fold protein YncE
VLYVASSTGNRILKLSGGTFVNFATLPAGSAPRAIVFSASGELFVANSSGNTISKVTAAGAVSQFSNDVTAPSGLAFDSTGKLHVLDSRQGGRLAEFNPQGKSRALVSSLGTVSGLGFDRAGSAFFGSAPARCADIPRGWSAMWRRASVSLVC